MSSCLFKNGDYEFSLTTIMRSIEIVEDLYHAFDFSDLCPKLKSKKSFYELSNFLSKNVLASNWIFN